jgi:cytochrome c oxidase subunit III
MSEHHGGYYIPEGSHWPFVGSIGLFTTMLGAVNWIHQHWFGPYLFMLGFLILVFMMFGWFGDVIGESRGGLYNEQVDRSYRWGMSWFIFTEVCFFGAFFGALFYARVVSVPWLGGVFSSDTVATHLVLWPNFKAHWPLMTNPDPAQFVGPKNTIGAWGLPAINTLLLLTSGVTLTWAHWALKVNKRMQLCIGMFLTIALGIAFLVCQAHEYIHAYSEGLTLHSGIYGTTFFMLTGFHGAHVTLGTIMLITILFRCMKGHFSADHHFAFEAVAWYWHFVDVVWLLLFVLVYWL